MTRSSIRSRAVYNRHTSLAHSSIRSGLGSTRRSPRGSRRPPRSRRSSARPPHDRSLDGEVTVTPWVQRLLIANILMFFLQQTVPGLDQALTLHPASILGQPWTIVTYMFLHAGLMHILFNMLALYFTGPRVEQRLGGNRFISLYMISGISGALLSFVFARNSYIVGA